MEHLPLRTVIFIYVEYRYRKTSLPLPRYCHILFIVQAVLPWNFPRPRGNYRDYCGITAFPLLCHPPVESDFIANSARDNSAITV